jgi:hypothetical protein
MNVGGRPGQRSPKGDKAGSQINIMFCAQQLLSKIKGNKVNSINSIFKVK